MAKEFLWRNDEVAAENRASAQTQTALAAPPKDAALRLTAGHSVHIDNSDATGYFIAINIKTGEKLVFTSHSPHEEARSTRPGTVDVGQHEFNDLVLLCSPAHPVVYQTGSAGFHAIKPEISLSSRLPAINMAFPIPLLAAVPQQQAHNQHGQS